MTDVLIIFVVALIVGMALGYIVMAKKRGAKCIGCPDGASCSGKCGGCGSGCDCGKES